MTTTRRHLLTGAAATLLGIGVTAGAQAQDQDKLPGQLSEEQLGQMVAALGIKPDKKEQRYDFAFKAKMGEEEWELSMSTVLSQDGRSIWVMAWLDQLPESAASVPRNALLRLLADGKRRIMTVDELRRGIEALGPGAYDEMSYYQRWMASISENLLEKGVISVDELGRRMAAVEARWRAQGWAGEDRADGDA